jgi:hypothetical protein
MAEPKLPEGALSSDVSTARSDLSSLQIGIVDNALAQALPVPDIMFGGGVLVLVVMFHAFWIRLITGSFLKRSQSIQALALMWRADLLFAGVVMTLLLLHLAEVVLWSAALILGDIVADWSKAAYFAANCYTALGEPFALPHAWRIVPPIIAMSGIFTFAWTASVLVNFVSRYNELREGIMAKQQQRKADGKRSP